MLGFPIISFQEINIIMTFYRLREDTLFDNNGNAHTVYGVDIFESTNGSDPPIDSFPDLFFDKDKACSFIRLINEEDLDRIHLLDVIEDELFFF